MALEPPPFDVSKTKQDLTIWDVFETLFMVIYTLEMVIKIMAFGFVYERYSYLRDPWNVMDFLIVLSSWFTIFGDQGNISTIRTVRLLRTLRTLRTI